MGLVKEKIKLCPNKSVGPFRRFSPFQRVSPLIVKALMHRRQILTEQDRVKRTEKSDKTRQKSGVFFADFIFKLSTYFLDFLERASYITHKKNQLSKSIKKSIRNQLSR